MSHSAQALEFDNSGKPRSNHVVGSYVKTAIACFAADALVLLATLLAVRWLPPVVGSVVAVAGALSALVVSILLAASMLVLARYRRGLRFEQDLFVEFNRSREADAIVAGEPPQVSRVRRWLARKMLGHDLVVGDWVEVKSWDEIRATLDDKACLDQLPFMHEMLAMCGQRARVFRGMHRLFDYRKSRKMRHMQGAVLLVGTVCNGARHGGCEAACHTIWKAEWLRRIDGAHQKVAEQPSVQPLPRAAREVSMLEAGTHGPRYACQLTQLHAASQPIGNWSLVNFFRPLVAGNVAPAAFVVAWLTHCFNELQHLRQGVSFPSFELPVQNDRPMGAPLAPGERIVVKPSAEIRATLNDLSFNKGLYFEPDMLKHCGRQFVVQAEIRKLVDIVSGQILEMKTPAYMLRGVHFSGERHIFNVQHEPLFWRQIWLARAKVEA